MSWMHWWGTPPPTFAMMSPSPPMIPGYAHLHEYTFRNWQLNKIFFKVSRSYRDIALELMAVVEFEPYHDEYLSFGQLIPQFRKSDFFPLTCHYILALVRGPSTPRQIRSCLWTIIDRTGPLESSLLCCCVTPQLLFSLRIGLWLSESATSEIMA